jgi:hypothetical protein
VIKHLYETIDAYEGDDQGPEDVSF